MFGMFQKGSFVHLGGDISIYRDDLIGVFDIERVTVNPSVNKFLAAAQKSGRIYYCSPVLESMPKSFVLTNETVFVTNVASQIIKKRANK